MSERLAAAAGAVLARHLAAALPSRRWFAGRTRAIRAVALEDLAVLDPDRAPGAGLALVQVTYADGGAERYTLPVTATAAPGEPATTLGASDGIHVHDASLDPAVMHALLAGFGRAARLATLEGGALLYEDVAPEDAARLRTICASPPRALGAEQSNTSFRAGDAAVFKLFRRVSDGEHPEVEIGRVLRSTEFTATPRLLGSLAYAAPDGARASLGVMQSFVESRGDGWSHVLGLLRAGPDAATLAGEARMLGRVTAHMHLALASRVDVAAFRPVRLAARHADAWRDSFAARAARVHTELRASAATLPARAAREAAALLQHASRWTAAPAGAEASSAFDLIRVHGDYHLGQTLRAEEGYVVMDFEGEPSRPLEERRAPHAALKDVAGMLRSFDYAAATADEARAEATAAALRTPFLAAYRERAGAASFLPREASAFDAWLGFFELDKALYEIEYELHHRPDWAWIPLSGIRRRIEAGP